jgi:hypothetical protein
MFKHTNTFIQELNLVYSAYELEVSMKHVPLVHLSEWRALH